MRLPKTLHGYDRFRRDPVSRKAADRLAARVRTAGEQLAQIRGTFGKVR